MNTQAVERPAPSVDLDENEYEEGGEELFSAEDELDFETMWDREEGHIYESIEEELPDANDSF